jgi:hypothetical protein
MTITAAFAYLLCLLGALAWVGGNLMFLTVVFCHSKVWFLSCLFIPPVDWLYFLFYAKQTWKTMLIITVGCIVFGIGFWLGGFNFQWLQFLG